MLWKQLPRFSSHALTQAMVVGGLFAVTAAAVVPTLTDAQIRSKLAQVQRDMHTLFIAVEAYRIDNGLTGDSDLSAVHTHTPNQHGFLTTPVAYIPAPMYDPFYDGSKAEYSCVGGNVYTLLWGLYHVELLNKPGVVPGWLVYADVITRPAYQQGKRYLTLSMGPNETMFAGQMRPTLDGPCGVVYEVSNGLRSIGDIFGFGPP